MLIPGSVEMEAAADRLLRPFLGRRGGVYTEYQLRRRHRREVPLTVELEYGTAFSLAEAARLEQDLREMVDRDLLRLGRMAGLSQSQLETWELRVAGLTEEMIAEVCKVSHQAVNSRLKRAKKKVIAILNDDKYYGLREVYQEEVNRICKAHPCRRAPRRIM